MNIILYIAIGLGALALIATLSLVFIIIKANKSNNKLKYRYIKVNDEYYQLMPVKKVSNYLDIVINDNYRGEKVNIEEKKEVEKEATSLDVKDEENFSFIINPSPKAYLDHKSKLVIHYSNILNPFLNVYFYNKGKLELQKKYLLNDYQVEDGKLLNIQALANLIKNDFNVSVPIVLLLSSNDIFKNVVSLPKISKGKANKLYLKELKESFPDYKENYDIVSNNYKHDLGYIYNTYFISHKVIDDFKLLATLLNSKIVNVDIFGNHLFNRIKNKYEGSYSIIYKEDEYCLFLNVYNNQLTTIYTFNSDDVSDIINQYLLIVSKHEFNFEKKSIKSVIVSKNIYFDIKDKLFLDVKPLEIDFDNYFGDK